MMKTKAMLISISIVVGNICLFTQACVWSDRTLEVVDSCPVTKEETIKAARIKRCEGIALRQNCTKPSQFKYHCLYSYRQKKFVEVCSIERYIHDVCIVYDTRLSKIQPIYNVRCRDISAACPERYLSTEGHLYATCPQLMNLTFYDTKGTNNNPQQPIDKSQIVIYLVVSFPIFIITMVSSMICFVAYKRKTLCWKQNENNSRQAEEHELQPLNTSTEDTEESKHHARGKNEQLLGSYEIWKTPLSRMFSKLSRDEMFVLFCFMCSDAGAPDFNDTVWLDILCEIRGKTNNERKTLARSQKANQILHNLSSRRSLINGQRISSYAADETIFHVHANTAGHGGRSNILFYLLSFASAWQYLRCQSYRRKSSEKCVIAATKQSDRLLVLRLQMDILTHAMLEDSNLSDMMFQILNIPKDILHRNADERGLFLKQLKIDKNRMSFNETPRDRKRGVVWNWNHKRHNMVRSCIGQYQHLDIFIIENIAYKIPSKYHTCTSDVRCLLYCLLLVDDYTLNINDQSHKRILNELRERYFTDLSFYEDINVTVLPEQIFDKQGSNLMFKSQDIRHDVMYAFVTECLVEDCDLEFFLKKASCHVVSEYCRSWNYERSKEEERCLYVPDSPKEMYGLFISKLNLDIFKHCTVSDESFCLRICHELQIPREILKWDEEARERYVEYAKKGTHEIHHARGMIVGCAGAGKTTLLKRLLRCTEKEVTTVQSTEGLNVHEEIFEISADMQTLEARKQEVEDEAKETTTKTISFFDFAGQCVYYACHQIYLTRRAFYIVVVDTSKHFDQIVDKYVCDQADTVFSGWTYGDYFMFWLKSIHTYCTTEDIEDNPPEVLIVATHWDTNIYQNNEERFLDSLQRQIPENSHLLQYVSSSNCFFTQFPLCPLVDLEKHIISIASHQRWTEKIPADWAFMETEIRQKELGRKIEKIANIKRKLPEGKTIKDMLRYYHDAGKILYFNEKYLNELIIMDVQWFVDAFKNIITDKLHVTGLVASRKDWEEYYMTGHLQDRLLTAIWEQKDKVQKKSGSLLHHKNYILQYMQRLGLVAKGKESHYVPCMNRKRFDDSIQKIIEEAENKSSVLIYLFDFLPFFLFFRLVVACMQIEGWSVVKRQGKPCLFQNVALFLLGENYIVIGVTATSVQLQVYHPLPGCSLEVEKTNDIQKKIESILTNLTVSFKREIKFIRGFSCENQEKQTIPMEVEEHFIWEQDIGRGESEICTLHQLTDRHTVNPNYLKKYWILQN